MRYFCIITITGVPETRQSLPQHKEIMKLSQFAIIAVLLLSVSAFAQEEKKPSPESDKAPQDKIAQKEEAVLSDRWYGMILDVTTQA